MSARRVAAKFRKGMLVVRQADQPNILVGWGAVGRVTGPAVTGPAVGRRMVMVQWPVRERPWNSLIVTLQKVSKREAILWHLAR